ncbi:MAG: cyclic nucleotide-binding domain-containing protein [Actinomycetia bacterium]|nr:cyclic nucleotide-binding domain-containing protein [Actinomycetes bacterium]MCP4222553.1 cyclic nucleotide-binding domain-containing protein [Actinomycetes bacterium]MCP5031114.1 cyclic nucleotide-binding domain-containing protein [Actinomycetes bacterium]
MSAITEVLDQQRFFAGLSAEAMEAIAGCGQEVKLDQETIVLVENQPADTFYLLLSGLVALEVATPRQGPFVIETIGPGEILGVSWLLPPYRWTFDARVVSEAHTIAIDAICLRQRCDADPRLGYELFQRFASPIRDRLQATRLQLIDLYGNHAS